MKRKFLIKKVRVFNRDLQSHFFWSRSKFLCSPGLSKIFFSVAVPAEIFFGPDPSENFFSPGPRENFFSPGPRENFFRSCFQRKFFFGPGPSENFFSVPVPAKIFFQSRSQRKFFFSPGPGQNFFFGSGVHSMPIKKYSMVKEVDKLSKNPDF